jgi:hypothetical protein
MKARTDSPSGPQAAFFSRLTFAHRARAFAGEFLISWQRVLQDKKAIRPARSSGSKPTSLESQRVSQPLAIAGVPEEPRRLRQHLAKFLHLVNEPKKERRHAHEIQKAETAIQRLN